MSKAEKHLKPISPKYQLLPGKTPTSTFTAFSYHIIHTFFYALRGLAVFKSTLTDRSTSEKRHSSTHFLRQFDYSSQPGVVNEIMENEPKICLLLSFIAAFIEKD